MRAEDHHLLRIAATHHHVVDLVDVRAAGLTPRQWRTRVDDGAWVEVARGVWRHSATPDSFAVRVHAGSRALGSRAALSGSGAAAWWGLDGFDAENESIVFAVPRDRRWQGATTVRATRDWRPSDVVFKDGVRVHTVTRVIIELAATGESARRIEAAIDSGVRHRLTSVPTLRRRISEAGGRGRAGIPLLRELMLDSGGESALERRFLRVARNAGLPRPRVQVPSTRDTGHVMRLDFVFPGGLVVEVSGRVGHASDTDRQKDARRRNALARVGVPSLEFTTADVMDDPDYVVGTIRALLR